MVEKLNESPLQPAVREILRQKVRDIIEEPTKRGFRVKLLC
jgi:hypothetical protein